AGAAAQTTRAIYVAATPEQFATARTKGFRAVMDADIEGWGDEPPPRIIIGEGENDQFLAKRLGERWPDVVLELERDLGQFRPMPVCDILPEPLASYVLEVSESMSVDPAAVAAPMLAACSGAIGDSRRIRVGSLNPPSALWICLVGSSGSRKSAAIDAATQFCKLAEREARDESAAARREYQANLKRMKQTTKSGPPVDEPTEPIEHRRTVGDVTLERLAMILQDNPRGVMMIRDELAAWFDFGRYSSGGGSSNRSGWCELFDGRSITVDRKGSASSYVESTSVSLVGGIQPDILRDLLTAQNVASGLMARLLFVSPPEQPGRMCEREIDSRLLAGVGEVFRKLYTIGLPDDAEDGVLRLSEDAKPLYRQTFDDLSAESHLAGEDDLKGALSKLAGIFARLCCVMQLVTDACSDHPVEAIEARGIIDREAVQRASVAAWWFRRELDRAYVHSGASEGSRDEADLIRYIEARGGSVRWREFRAAKQRRYAGAEGEARLESIVKGSPKMRDHYSGTSRVVSLIRSASDQF
ncbi:MAG: DUF3987 domain-containing protein, partial [Planctomycetota bacterium]